MPTPVDLFEAVIARLRSDATCAGLLTGGIRADEIPPGSISGNPFHPYAVLSEVGGSRQYMAKTDVATFIEDAVLQVAAYAIGRSLAYSCGSAIANALNDAPLAFSDGSLMYLRQTNRHASLDPSLTVGGSAVWQELREFRYVFSGSI